MGLTHSKNPSKKRTEYNKGNQIKPIERNTKDEEDRLKQQRALTYDRGRDEERDKEPKSTSNILGKVVKILKKKIYRYKLRF
jgi:hypothetical protein